ncbi:hypothetical protein CLAVI_000955 [Candidatus Clavichlamydia salmonicola]|nr:hypothetical protein [Candidatus Clavichlamydia salmonicola]
MYTASIFSKHHCISFSTVMYASSILFLMQSVLSFCLKAYGPSKKEQIFLKLE